MRRGRILIFLVLIVVIGLALLYFAYTQFGQVVAPQPTQAALTEVYYAAQNIPQGTKITKEMLGTFSIPPDKVADVMFTVGEESRDYCLDGWHGSGRDCRPAVGCEDTVGYGRGDDSNKSSFAGWLRCWGWGACKR
jgi:Flp pilus assembly protein CpaB